MDAEHIQWLTEVHGHEYTMDRLESGEQVAFDNMASQLGGLVANHILDSIDSHDIAMTVIYGTDWMEIPGIEDLQ